MEQQKIRVMVIDDDSKIRDIVRILLTRYFDDHIDIVAEATTVESAVTAVRANQPQLLLLDIELPDGMGFEILDLLGEERKKFHVIFITSHGKHMHRALRYGAVDYLDKMIVAADFKVAVERGIAYVQENRAVERQKPPSNHTLFLNIRHNTGEETMIAVGTIICCKADSNYTHIILTNRRPVIASKTLKHYENVLGNYGFVRVSRNLVINPEHCQVQLDKSNTIVIQMPDGSIEQIDPAYLAVVKKELMEILE